MATIGVICPSLWGHLNPMLSLAKELNLRAHTIIFYQIPELAPKITQQGLTFFPIGQVEYPEGFLKSFVQALGRLQGIEIIRYWYAEQEKMTKVVFRDIPALIKQNPVDLLLVDQVEPAGQAIAEYLNIPFITVCNALALNREPGIPPVFTPWGYQLTGWGQLRNRIAYYIGDSLVSSYKKLVSQYRQKWDLPRLSGSDLLFANSPLAYLSQQPPEFDFPRKKLPHNFYYCGPFRDQTPSDVVFPYERLTGQPLIYASLGTLQNTKFDVFSLIAAACRNLDVQLVISHGGGLTDEEVAHLAAHSLVVSYAPQLELLQRASLTITHAGLNTVLDSLACGVPLVALPQGFEQPTIAARIQWTQVGEVIPAKQLSTNHLRMTIDKVLDSPIYRENAQHIQQHLQKEKGVNQAADIIEQELAQNS